jgi:hypothetical protein
MNREVYSLGAFPSLPRRGGRAIKKWSRSEKARPGWSLTSGVSECVLKRVLRLTTPSAALRWLRDFLLMPQPPLLCKEGKVPNPERFITPYRPLVL